MVEDILMHSVVDLSEMAKARGLEVEINVKLYMCRDYNFTGEIRYWTHKHYCFGCCSIWIKRKGGRAWMVISHSSEGTSFAPRLSGAQCRQEISFEIDRKVVSSVLHFLGLGFLDSPDREWNPEGDL